MCYITFLVRTILRLIFAAFNKRKFTAEGEVLLLPFQSRLLLGERRNQNVSFVNKTKEKKNGTHIHAFK